MDGARRFFKRSLAFAQQLMRARGATALPLECFIKNLRARCLANAAARFVHHGRPPKKHNNRRENRDYSVS